MENFVQEYKKPINFGWGIFVGLLIGSAVSASAMLLLVPQSGEKTRAQIRKNSMKLRDHTSKAVEDAVSQVSDKVRQVKADMRKEGKALDHRGQIMLDGQKKRWDTLVDAGRTAMRGS